MNKNELRIKFKQVRKDILDKNNQSEIIYQKIINNKCVNKCDTVLLYSSLNDEVDTFKMINYFLKHKKVALPRVRGNDMDFYYIKSVDELKKGSFDILEPTSNDKVTSNNCVCIVPGICFDKNGYRIGYGKGYYDKYLSNKSIYKIGICFKECLIDNMSHDLYDIKVDLIVSSF